MHEQPAILEEELVEEQQPELLPEASESPEPQPPAPLMQRTWVKRAAASFALAGSLTSIANQPTLRTEAARAVANFVYESPLGWDIQIFDAYVEHKAGWDKPVETTIKTYRNPEHPTPHDAKVTNFVIPGFREMHDEEITQQLVDASEHNYPTRYVAYGNQPVTPDSLAQLIIKNLEEDPLKTREIGFTGHSMGGILLLEALARVHEMGYPLPKIAFIDFLSTPAGMQTVRHAGLADFFTKTGIGQKAAGAYATEVLQQLDAQHFNVFRWLPHDIAKAWNDLPKGASDALGASQLKDLDKIDSEQALRNLLMRLHGVISRDTKVTYFGPVNPSTDTVVDDIASYHTYYVIFDEQFGITVNYVWWGDGHAKSDFDTNGRAKRLYNLSILPKITPKPLSPVLIPGITSPSPTQSILVSPSQPPVIAAGGPAPTEAPSPSPSP